ncbi:MAG TPA: DUF2490 domain-containing protein [Pyrinomonadaceae bacterium]|nr:DUF2490 domain-containing protein [Pyrinomonadaceae bacterium]
MYCNISRAVLVGFLIVSWCAGAGAQADTRTEIWSEVDVYVPLDEKFRLFFMIKVNRAEETRDDREVTLGAHVDYNVNKRFTLRGGYRYVFAPGDNPFKEHRLITEQTFRQDLPLAILVSDRNRQDFRVVNGSFSFRYRNRVMLEREFRVFERSITPYGAVEVFYDTRFDVWNRNRLTAGTQIQLKRGFPLLRELTPRKQVILDLYYTKQNDSRSQPNHIHAIGASLALHF